MRDNKLIIFDFDGVIADSLQYIHQIMNTLADKHGFKKVDTDEHFSDLMNINLLEMVSRLEIPKHLLPIIFVEYKNMMKREYRNIHLYKGMKEVITKLAEDNTLAIVSSNHKDLIEFFLEHHKLKHFFQKIMGTEFSYHKDKKLKHLVEDIKPEKAFFITDTLGDVKDAQSIENLTTVGVRWGYHTWSKDDKVQPDILVSDTEKLLEKLR